MISEKNKVEQLLWDIIEREGGYVNHPSDRGGPTKYGVTIKTLSQWQRRQATIDDVKAVDKKTAFKIFYRLFYERPNIDSLPLSIQPMLTDMAVNHGPKNTIHMLQDVLDTCGYNLGKLDGICGPKTAASAKTCWHQLGNDFIRMLVCRRKAFYQAIAQNDPTQVVFLKGWINRAESFMV